MTFQIVFQWLTSQVGFDRLVVIEDALIAGLDEAHEVDGHDIGSTQCNIFILTDDWKSAQASATSIVDSINATDGLAIGYRALTDEQYVSLWPKNAVGFSVS